MSLLVSLLVVILFSLIFHKPLKRFPFVFYLIAAGVAALGMYFTLSPHPSSIIRACAFALQKGQVAFAFFTLVMFIGVFDKDSAVRRLYNPIRAQLSIMGTILILGHLSPYLANYLRMLSSIFSLSVNILFSLMIACVLIVLVVLLAATSFNVIKKQMSSKSWKRVQMLAYPFYALIFFHLLGYLIVPAMNGSMIPLVNLMIYCMVFALYAILRIRKALRDSRQHQAEAELAKET